ncbi:MAG: hypothetical protein R6V01_02445 [Thermoplasmatota archaeon]
MARRRVIHQEEEKEEKKTKPAFTPSEFDETEFLQTENKSAKMIYISLSVAFLAGIGSFVIMRAAHWLDLSSYMTVPIIAPFIFLPLVLYVFSRFDINIKELSWKKYLENGFMYLLAWFAVWMISMNPPFSDFSNPHIEDPIIVLDSDSGKQVTYVGTGSDTVMFVDDVEKTYQSISNISGVTNVEIYLPITDNWKLETVDVSISERKDGSWKEIEDLEQNAIFIGWNDSFEPDKNVSERVKNEWIQEKAEVWEGNLFAIKFTLTDLKNKTYDLHNGIQLRIDITAKDSRGNESRSLRDIKISTPE